MCIQHGLTAANIQRNGENGVTARLAEVNSEHKNNQLKQNAISGEISRFCRFIFWVNLIFFFHKQYHIIIMYQYFI